MISYLLTDGRTLLDVKSLSRLKNFKKLLKKRLRKIILINVPNLTQWQMNNDACPMTPHP